MEKISFLIVEDDETHRNSIVEVTWQVAKKLRKQAIIEKTETYRKALNQITKNTFDVLIIDEKLPGGTGLKLAEKARKKRPFQRIILITGYSTDELESRAKMTGVVRYIAKKAGYEKLFRTELEEIISKELYCFVVTPYDKEYLNFFENVLKPFLEQVGLKAVLAKNLFSKENLLDEIVEGITNSFMVICNISEENLNVYYELGLAHGQGKPVILITEKTENIPSDLKGKRYLQYKKNNLKDFEDNMLTKMTFISLDCDC